MKELKKEAKKYLADNGLGTGSNFTVDTVAGMMELFTLKKIKQLENRYIDAHCNPDFEGDKMQYIFGDNSKLKNPPETKWKP